VRRALAAASVALVALACGTQDWSFDADAGATGDGGATCASDSDCRLSTLHCDTASHRCVACLVDLQCEAPLPRCDNDLHQCVNCLLGTDCSGGEVCDAIAHRCMRSCADGGACPSYAPHCSPPRWVCVECQNSGDCANSPAGHVCDVAAGKCVSCVAGTSCPSDRPHCDRRSGRGVQCLSSADCAHDEPLCDPVSHECVGPQGH
jgi:hypothetical protein